MKRTIIPPKFKKKKALLGTLIPPSHEPIVLFEFCFRNLVFSEMTSSRVGPFDEEMKLKAVTDKGGELGFGNQMVDDAVESSLSLARSLARSQTHTRSLSRAHLRRQKTFTLSLLSFREKKTKIERVK